MFFSTYTEPCSVVSTVCMVHLVAPCVCNSIRCTILSSWPAVGLEMLLSRATLGLWGYLKTQDLLTPLSWDMHQHQRHPPPLYTVHWFRRRLRCTKVWEDAHQYCFPVISFLFSSVRFALVVFLFERWRSYCLSYVGTKFRVLYYPLSGQILLCSLSLQNLHLLKDYNGLTHDLTHIFSLQLLTTINH